MSAHTQRRPRRQELNRRARSRAGATKKRGNKRLSSRFEKSLCAVPARIMKPRVMVIAVSCILAVFGLLMVYSASSVHAQARYGDAAYFLKRQAIFAVISFVLAICIARIEYHRLLGVGLIILFGCVLVALIGVKLAGIASHGATRWFAIGPFRLQPSEFAKPMLVLMMARLVVHYFKSNDWTLQQLLISAGVFIGLPLVLVFLQPDKGSTIIIVTSLAVMALVAGVPLRFFALALAVLVGVMVLWSLKDAYSSARIATLFNPWADKYGAGYQLVQGFYAFANGGLFGVGIGMSKQKYSYLPEAHNDFIFAIIGEECGLLGALGVLAGFALLAWAGLHICKNSPDLAGQLIALGCTSLIIIQMFVNVLGVLSVVPLTGKPVPFLSYGGSSLIVCGITVGILVSVSRGNALPKTASDRRRARIREVLDDDISASSENVPVAHVHRGLRLVEDVSSEAPALDQKSVDQIPTEMAQRNFTSKRSMGATTKRVARKNLSDRTRSDLRADRRSNRRRGSSHRL